MRQFIEMNFMGATLQSHHRYDGKLMMRLIQSNVREEWKGVGRETSYLMLCCFIIYLAYENVAAGELTCLIFGCISLYLFHKVMHRLAGIYWKRKCLRNIVEHQRVFDSD